MTAASCANLAGTEINEHNIVASSLNLPVERDRHARERRSVKSLKLWIATNNAYFLGVGAVAC